MDEDKKIIYFITSNANKVREMNELVSDSKNIKINQLDIELTEIQGTGDEIIKSKLFEAMKNLQKPWPKYIAVEDTSLCFEALNGLPGPYIKTFYEKLNNNGLIQLLNGFSSRKAIAECRIGLLDICRDEYKIFLGECKGYIISNEERGNNGFAWDKIFCPKDSEKTFAEMSIQEKNQYSHRMKAFQKLIDHFSFSSSSCF